MKSLYMPLVNEGVICNVLNSKVFSGVLRKLYFNYPIIPQIKWLFSLERDENYD